MRIYTKEYTINSRNPSSTFPKTNVNLRRYSAFPDNVVLPNSIFLLAYNSNGIYPASSKSQISKALSAEIRNTEYHNRGSKIKVEPHSASILLAFPDICVAPLLGPLAIF
jgi:hypothetical protein